MVYIYPVSGIRMENIFKRSLRAAMRALDIQTGLILSYDETDTFTVEEGVIQMLPVWQWLLKLGA